MAENLKTTLVTVLMPVYNGGSYLREAIESILRQTYHDFEFLIIDDGSTDSSQDVITSFSDDRIRFIRNENNLGLIKTLNLGIEMISTPFIARFDADDIAEKFRLEKQIDFMQKHPDVGVCGTGFYLLKDKSRIVPRQPPVEPKIIKCKLLFNCPIVHPSVMIRRSVLDKTTLHYDENYKDAEDYELWSRLMNKTEFANLNTKLITYRIHSSQVSTIGKIQQRNTANKVRLKLLSDLGIVPDNEEFKIHELLCYEEYPELLRQLPETEKWLLKIATANELYRVYDDVQLKKTIMKYWSNAIVYSLKGFKAYREFYRSGLYDSQFFSFVERIKFLVKCLVK